MIQVGKKQVPPPVSVTTAKVQQVEWQPLRPAVGTLDRPARDDPQRRADRDGPGDWVRERLAGQEGPDHRQARHLRRAGAAGRARRPTQALAKQTLDRAENLRQQEVNTQAELENAPRQATSRPGRPSVNLQAIINKKIIRAPFDGRAGIRARRARPGGLAGDAHRVAADGEPDLRRVPASPAGARRREAGPEGRAEGRRLSRVRAGKARSPPSTPRSIRGPATSGCAPRWRTPTAG